MGKRERKIELIKKYIGNISGTYPTYFYGKIPQDKAKEACSSYAGAVAYEDIIGLVDITILGNGKKGLLFTEKKVYYNNGFLGDKGSISYQKIHEDGTIPGSIFSESYNKQALIELLSGLANIEGESWEKNVSQKMDNVNHGLETVTEVIEKGKEIYNTLSSFAKLFATEDTESNETENDALNECEEIEEVER